MGITWVYFRVIEGDNPTVNKLLQVNKPLVHVTSEQLLLLHDIMVPMSKELCMHCGLHLSVARVINRTVFC